MRQNEAVEGVILMRVGEQAQVVLKKVQELTETLNRSVLPQDVKIVPYYDRTDLIQETTKTVERNLLRGMSTSTIAFRPASDPDFLPAST